MRLQGRPIVLNFWAGLCHPFWSESPEFQVFHDEFKDRVTLLRLGVVPHEDSDESLGVTDPTGWIDESSVTRKYGVTGMPTAVFVDSAGKIFDWRVGAIDRNALGSSITRPLMAEAETSANWLRSRNNVLVAPSE